MQKLVDDVLNEGEVIVLYEKVNDLPYLYACLDESMSTYPTISHGLIRATPPIASEATFVPGADCCAG